MWQRAAGLVTPGNLEDDIDKLADCDWIVEAVLEDPEVKRDLYKRLESVRKDGSIVSSNTSTLPLTLLTEGLPERFRSEEHTSELQSLMRISYAVFCLKQKNK